MYNLPIDYDVAQNITRLVLIEQYNFLLEDYKEPENVRVPMYSSNPEVNQKKLLSTLKALYKTIKYFSTVEELKSVEKYK